MPNRAELTTPDCLSACFWSRVGGKDSTELVVEGEHHRVPQEFIDELASFLGVSLVIRVAAGALSSSTAMAMMRARRVFDVSSGG